MSISAVKKVLIYPSIVTLVLMFSMSVGCSEKKHGKWVHVQKDGTLTIGEYTRSEDYLLQTRFLPAGLLVVQSYVDDWNKTLLVIHQEEKNGVLYCNYKRYRKKDGLLMSDTNFRERTPHGYHLNMFQGILREEGYYVNGRREGEWLMFDDYHKEYRTNIYQNGMPFEGFFTTFKKGSYYSQEYHEGHLVQEVRFHLDNNRFEDVEPIKVPIYENLEKYLQLLEK